MYNPGCEVSLGGKEYLFITSSVLYTIGVLHLSALYNVLYIGNLSVSFLVSYSVSYIFPAEPFLHFLFQIYSDVYLSILINPL